MGGFRPLGPSKIAPRAVQDRSKTRPRGVSNLSFISTPLENDFGPIWGPILGPKLGHFGVNFGSFFELVFETLSGAILDPSWSRFGAQVGGKKPPKTVEGCSKIKFSAFRFRPRFGRLFGPLLGPSWGPSWGPKRLQNRSKTRSKFELNFKVSWEPFWADLGPHLGPQDGPKSAPRRKFLETGLLFSEV